jgi:hypothetical protein
MYEHTKRVYMHTLSSRRVYVYISVCIYTHTWEQVHINFKELDVFLTYTHTHTCTQIHMYVKDLLISSACMGIRALAEKFEELHVFLPTHKHTYIHMKTHESPLIPMPAQFNDESCTQMH